MKSFRSVIDAFPSRKTLAQVLGVRVDAVQKWHQRDSIPPEHDFKLVEAAKSVGVALTFEDIARIRCSASEQAA